MVEYDVLPQVAAEQVGWSIHEIFWVHRTVILSRYEHRLQRAGFSADQNTELWREVWTQAEAVVAECCASIRAPRTGAVVIDLKGRSAGDPEAIGGNVALSEFLRATMILSDVVVDSFTEILRLRPDGVRLLSSVFRVLNRRMSAWSQAMFAANEAELLDRARQVQVEDRRRLSRDIHDWVGNAISLADRNLELFEVLEERGLPGGEQRVALARQAVGEVLDGTRRIVADLRTGPPVGSIEHAVRAFMQSAAPDGVASRIELRGDEARLPADVRDDLFVVVRECLRNSFRHADAECVRVFIGVGSRSVVVVVEDDGAGFDVVAARVAGRGHGLDAAQERIELLGGSLLISSTPGRGTRIEIDVPLVTEHAQHRVAS